MKKILFISLFLIFQISSVYCSEDDVKYSGNIEYSYLEYTRQDNSETPDTLDELKYYPKIDLSFANSYRMIIEGDLRNNFKLDERNHFNFKEFWIEIEKEKWSLKIGKQIIEWGRTDTIKPTNIFNIKDMTDLIDTINTGIPAVKFTRYIDMNELEFVLIPEFAEHRLPYNDNSHWFFFPRTNGQMNLLYSINKDDYPSENSSSSQVGIRLNHIGTGFDWAIVGAKTFDRMPTYFRKTIERNDINLKKTFFGIYPNYKSIYLIGVDGTTTFSQYGLRGEAAYIFTEDIKSKEATIDDPYLQMVLGIDRTYSDIFKDWDLFLLLQYALDKELPVHGIENQDEADAKFNHFYRQAGLFNSELKFSEFNKLILKGFRNLEKEDYIFQTEYIHKPQDVIELKVGFDLLGGMEDGFFGYFDKNDRIKVGLKYYY
ncbi:hypothetical protein HZA55_09970 [Candidatus Poribacteria bacterium]|nr:hypothetical protein [Candidatus Poribacteria bacterium]